MLIIDLNNQTIKGNAKAKDIKEKGLVLGSICNKVQQHG